MVDFTEGPGVVDFTEGPGVVDFTEGPGVVDKLPLTLYTIHSP